MCRNSPSQVGLCRLHLLGCFAGEKGLVDRVQSRFCAGPEFVEFFVDYGGDDGSWCVCGGGVELAV